MIRGIAIVTSAEIHRYSISKYKLFRCGNVDDMINNRILEIVAFITFNAPFQDDKDGT